MLTATFQGKPLILHLRNHEDFMSSFPLANVLMYYFYVSLRVLGDKDHSTVLSHSAIKQMSGNFSKSLRISWVMSEPGVPKHGLSFIFNFFLILLQTLPQIQIHAARL